MLEKTRFFRYTLQSLRMPHADTEIESVKMGLVSLGISNAPSNLDTFPRLA